MLLLNFYILYNRLSSVSLSVFYPPTDISNRAREGVSLNILKETHLVSSFTARFIQALHKQTWKIQTSDHNTQKKNSGKKELLFGELNELWRCGSLAHPAAVLINHCQPERTNLCCCTEPWLMCTLGVALKETQLNKAVQYLWQKNLVFNLHALLILVYWSFNWLRQMNHHCSFSIGLTCDLRICFFCTAWGWSAPTLQPSRVDTCGILCGSLT